MRWLIRIVLTWAVLLPLGYYVGLPYAAHYLQTKTRAQTMTQCQQQLLGKRLTGGANALLSAAEGDSYCHCLVDPLIFTREDLFDMATQYLETGQRQPPARLKAQLTAQVDTCHDQLQGAITAKMRARQSSASLQDSKQGATFIIP